MTSRRALRTYQQRKSRAFQFRPGHVGGRVDSAQPVRRLGGISAQVDPEDVVVANDLLLWFKLDETSGSTATSDSTSECSTCTLSISSAPTWEAVALAPGSSAAATFGNNVSASSTWSSYALAPGSDGLIVFDLWVSGVENGSDTETVVLGADDGNTGQFRILRGLGYVKFQVDGSLVHQEDDPDDPAHFVWSINPTSGAMTADINDVTVYTTSGSGALNWSQDYNWFFEVGAADNGSTFDEVKVYGSHVTPEAP